ncbi:N-acetyltransferase 6-like protein [Dinothrombium tinctorium]|uniref:N-acetyltransferase 6-like protein n=1 Tax=Dinothrombium tinctorium TaxID=1965070 RepID=A0A3S3RXQ5_9ACAR|nr:N-acetyltransferase 6-like protein [Dinothrombium tinctorium]
MEIDLLKLHTNNEYLNECVAILNEEWPRSETARLHSLQKSCDNLPISLILADSTHKRVIGHVRISREHFDHKCAFIETLLIRKEMRGKGFGKYLMEKSERFCEQMGFTKIKLTTIDKIDFYARLGYKVINNRCENFATTKSETIEINGVHASLPASNVSQAVNSASSSIPLSPPMPPPPPPLSNVSIKSGKFTTKTLMEKTLK